MPARRADSGLGDEVLSNGEHLAAGHLPCRDICHEDFEFLNGLRYGADPKTTTLM